MDLVAKALARIIWQYKNSPKFKEWVSSLPEIGQSEIEDPAEKIINVLDIDAQEGHLLELVGRIVGQPRNDPLLNDDEVYKIVIKSKAWKNNSDGRIDSISQAAANITGAAVRKVDDNQDMSFSIIFLEHLSTLARELLVTFDIIPRPQGVKLTGFIEPGPEGLAFGFSEPGMATPSYIAGFAEIGGLWALELSDGSILELNDGTLLGLEDPDNVPTVPGGFFTEFIEV